MIDKISVTVLPCNGTPQRLVIAKYDNKSYRDKLDTDSARRRCEFKRAAASKFGLDVDDLDFLDDDITAAADSADADAEAKAAELATDLGSNETDDGPQESQATKLVKLAAEADLFHDADSTAFARIAIDDHLEVWPLRSRGFRRWLARCYFNTFGGAPGSQALQDAINVLEGKACFEGKQHRTFIRLAEHQGNIYLDLCNDQWQAVEIDAAGWRVIDDPPVMFRRVKAMLSLQTPRARGDIELLRKYVNVVDDDWPLLVAHLVQSLRPRGPYPNLNIASEQGSGKSTVTRILRALTDPNTAPLRSEPREPRDLMIAANNGWMIVLDNLSHLPQWLSDCLCRLATGGGFSTRTLYENDEETIFNAQRPVIFNGIEEVASRGDLLERSLTIHCPRIDEDQRRPESDLWREFEEDQPAILGGLLDAVSAAIRNLPSTKLDTLPRMADFALWVSAAESALPWPAGTFMARYNANRESTHDVAIEASPVGKAMIDFSANVITWTGTAGELLAELDERADDRTTRLKSWPKTPRKLGGDLRRLAPDFRALGVAIEFEKEAGGKRRRLIRIELHETVPTDPTVPNAEYHGTESRTIDGTIRTPNGQSGDGRDDRDGTSHPHSNSEEQAVWEA